MRLKRTVRHYKFSFEELKEKLGIRKVEEVIEIHDRNNDLFIATQELDTDKINNEE